jgi:hypothetical protein
MITLFNIFILSWLLTHFSPIKMIFDMIPIKKLNALFSLIISIIVLPFSCMMCMSFWIGLIWTHSIITAATVSFIGYLWSKIEAKIEYERF